MKKLLLIPFLMDKNLSDLRFTANPMEYTSVATIAHLYAEGERLTLYLKNDGKFCITIIFGKL